MPRRRTGTLLPIEHEVLATAMAMRSAGTDEFHGFGIAQAMSDARDARSLTAHGTLYKALGRLERDGLLTSCWEDAALAVGRPPRRLYRLTAEGVQATIGAPRPRTQRTPARAAGAPA